MEKMAPKRPQEKDKNLTRIPWEKSHLRKREKKWEPKTPKQG